MKGSLKIRVNLDKKEYDKQLENLSSQIKSKQAEIKKLYSLQNSAGAKNINGKKYDYTSSIKSAEIELEKLKNQYISLDAKANPAIQKQEINWNKLTGKIKRFGLSLFGIRSIYSLVSRASSAYLSMDTELADKLQSVWKGLGSFLAPALEAISNALLKAIGYLNVFIYELTKVDFIARANAKAIKSQSGAVKELNKQMLGFDEANAFSSKSSGGSGGSSGGLIEIPELDENVIKKLQDLAKWLKKNWDLIKDVGEILLITFGVAKIAKVLKAIKSLIGIGSAASASGLAGIAYFLGILAAGVIITIAAKGIKEVEKQIEGLQKQTSALNDAIDTNKTLVKKLEEQYDEFYKAGTLTEDIIKRDTTALNNQIDSSLRVIESIKTTTIEKQKETEALKDSIGFYKKMYDQGSLNKDQQKTYAEYLGKTIEALDKQGVSTKNLKTDYEKLTGQKYETTVTVKAQADTKQAESSLSTFFNKVGQSLSHTLDISSWGSGWTKKLKSIWNGKLATGGIVNNPGQGVSLGSVTTGEAGREGVIPLTDPSAMEELGATIGKYITINNMIDNYVDGKKLNRLLAKSKSTSDFASNR